MKMLLVKFCLVAEITQRGREKGSVVLFCFWIWELMLHFFVAWLSFVWLWREHGETKGCIFLLFNHCLVVERTEDG